jgi:hypothetical protein
MTTDYLLLDWPDMAASRRLPVLRTKEGEVLLDWELSSNRQFITALGRRWSLEDGESFSEGAINLYEQVPTPTL